MRKSVVVLVSFGLLIVLALSAGCVPLPAPTEAARTTSVAGAGPTMTAAPTGTSPSEISTATTEATSTAETLATPEVSTSLPPGATPPAEATPARGRSVTLDDNGKTVALQPGDRFLLNLGEGYNWDVSIADPSIVSRVIGVLTIRGSQGLYEAHEPGTTALTATGDPDCRTQQPACALPSRLFEVQIVVSSSAS
jgi:hypothetical protein